MIEETILALLARYRQAKIQPRRLLTSIRFAIVGAFYVRVRFGSARARMWQGWLRRPPHTYRNLIRTGVGKVPFEELMRQLARDPTPATASVVT